MTKTDIVVTPKQLEEMRHALGLDYKKQPYRNYFYTTRTDPTWTDLVDKGLAVMRHGWEDDKAYFKCTYAGAKLAYGKQLPEQRFKEL